MIDLDALEKTECPVRTAFGCRLCPWKESERYCIGRRVIEAQVRMDDTTAQLEEVQKSVKRIQTRNSRLRTELHAAESRENILKKEVSGLKEQIRKDQAVIATLQTQDGFKIRVREGVERRMAGGVQQKPGSTQPRSLCGACPRCDCSWMLRGEPVPGWVAEPSTIYKDGYVVIACPRFSEMEPRRTDNCELTEQEFRTMNRLGQYRRPIKQNGT